MLTSPAQRAPKSNLVVPIILGVILVPLSQIGMAFLGARGASLLPWLVGTPICYFLTGGLGAFTTVSGLIPARARSRGAWVGFIAGISGACSAGLIVAAIAVWALAASPESVSLLHPHAGITPRLSYIASGLSLRFPLIWAIVILLPIFLGVNLLGVGLAPLGGMLGGYLRARVSPEIAPPLERIGEGERARSKRGILVITIVAVLLAIMVITAGLLYAVGDFAASAG